MGADTSSLNKIYIAHQRFNLCEVKLQAKQIKTSIPIDFSQFDFDYWKKQLQQLKSDPNSNLLFLPLSYDQKLPSFNCNTRPQLNLTFENYPFLLEQQITNRSINNQQNYFDQPQLWMLLYSLLKSQRAFSNISLKVGDIHPHNIFINSQGYPRLACQFTWPNQKTNYQKMFYDKTFRFISPQQMKLCQQGQSQDLCYSNSSQAFSIGLTMLSVGLLQNLDRVCDLKTFKFNQQYLDYCISRWMTLKYKHPQTEQYVMYSNQLKDIVKNLCCVNKHERFLSSNIYDILKPYEQKIMNIQAFQFQNYGGLRKQLSPKIQLVTNHKQLFDKYASSGSKQQQNKRFMSDVNFNKQLIKGQQLNSQQRRIFNTYANFSGQQKKDNSTNGRNLLITSSKQKSLQDIRKDLQIQFNESILQQKKQIGNNDFNRGNQNGYNGGQRIERYVQFKQSYFQPPKITKSQIYTVPMISAPKASQITQNKQYDSSLLSKIQMQIKSSQNNFPPQQTYVSENVGTGDYKV